jgi:2-aminoadipate transaminase
MRRVCGMIGRAMNDGQGAPTADRTTARDSSRFEDRFAARATGIKSSAMRDLMSLTERPEIISLAGGLPDTDSFPDEIFSEVWGAVATTYKASSLQYGPTEGLLELRQDICEIMHSEGAIARPDEILVTAGGQQAIALAIGAFIDPGDIVIAEGPTYPGAVPTLTTNHAHVVHIPLDTNGMSIDSLEEHLDRLDSQGRRPKLIYTIPNFHNPGGVTMSLERRHRLVALAAERDILIVEDNPYGAIRFEGEALPSLYELDAGAGGVVYLSTFSKILSPGVRIGWVAAPAPILRKMNLGKQAIDLCSSTLGQRFIIEYLRRHDWREHVGRLNMIYRSRRDAMLAALSNEFPTEAIWSHPQGGLFVWATLPEYLQTSELLARAIERHQVAFVPGAAAFLDGQGQHSMRLNFSSSSEEKITEGVHRIGAAIEAMTALQRAFGGGV